MRNKLFTTALVSVLALLLVVGVGLAEEAPPLPTLEIETMPTTVYYGIPGVFITSINNPADGETYEGVDLVVRIEGEIETTDGFDVLAISGASEFPSGFSVVGEAFVGKAGIASITKPYGARSTAQCVFLASPGTYTMTLDLVDGGEVIVSSEPRTFEVEPLIATFEAIDSVGISGVTEVEGKLFQGYQLMHGETMIPLFESKIKSIQCIEPEGSTLVVKGDGDPYFWFNVERSSGDYVYELVTKDVVEEGTPIYGRCYRATLNWVEPEEVSPTGPKFEESEDLVGFSLDGLTSEAEIFRKPTYASGFGSFEDYTSPLPDEPDRLWVVYPDGYEYVYYFYDNGKWFKTTIVDNQAPTIRLVDPANGRWDGKTPIVVEIQDDMSYFLPEGSAGAAYALLLDDTGTLISDLDMYNVSYPGEDKRVVRMTCSLETDDEIGEGIYELLVEAWDEFSNSRIVRFTLTVGDDDEDPEIVSMERVDSTLTVVVEDNAGLDKVILYVDGEMMGEVSVTGQQVATVEFELPDVGAGVHTIKVVVVDQAGLESERSMPYKVRPAYEPGKGTGFGWEMWKN